MVGGISIQRFESNENRSFLLSWPSTHVRFLSVRPYTLGRPSFNDFAKNIRRPVLDFQQQINAATNLESRSIQRGSSALDKQPGMSDERGVLVKYNIFRLYFRQLPKIDRQLTHSPGGSAEATGSREMVRKGERKKERINPRRNRRVRLCVRSRNTCGKC